MKKAFIFITWILAQTILCSQVPELEFIFYGANDLRVGEQI
jgi:hypothetical protein